MSSPTGRLGLPMPLIVIMLVCLRPRPKPCRASTTRNSPSNVRSETPIAEVQMRACCMGRRCMGWHVPLRNQIVISQRSQNARDWQWRLRRRQAHRPHPDTRSGPPIPMCWGRLARNRVSHQFSRNTRRPTRKPAIPLIQWSNEVKDLYLDGHLGARW